MIDISTIIYNNSIDNNVNKTKKIKETNDRNHNTTTS